MTEAAIPRVLPPRRRALLLRALHTGGSAAVGDLAARFGVSEMTIRRDLNLLAREGKLTRVHGGAVSDAVERPFAEAAVKALGEKTRIGAAAAALVGDGETVFVDIGTTTLQLVRHLRGRNVTVVTSSLAVYDELMSDESVQLILLGGVVRRNYRSLVGFVAEDVLRQLSADRAFLGASAIRDDLSVMDSTIVEVPIKRGMIAGAAETVLLVDSRKFGAPATARVCGPDDIDVVVTDAAAPAAAVASLRRAGVKVIRA